jgi:3-oxoacyl-[acyl-carrier protein] reductase
MEGSMIILTGASGGIGKAILPLLSKIDDVIAISYSKEIDIANLDNVESYQFDLASENEVNEFISKIKNQLSRVVLVNAAAISLDNLFINFDTKDWNRVLDLNLNGSFFLTRAILDTMVKDQWGRIVHISSVAGIKGVRGTAAYSVTKTGILGMSKVLANEYARFGITSNVLILGYFNTGLIDELSKDSYQKIVKSLPSKKLGNPSNIVNAINFIIMSEYVNGAKINIDGGI